MFENMLAGSYERYKKDTDTFTTWLSKAAAGCGYTAPMNQRRSQNPHSEPLNPTSPPDMTTLAKRLRAQAEKKAKKREAKKAPILKFAQPAGESGTSAARLDETPTETYTLAASEIIRQAEAVAKSPKVGIPNAMAYILDRAIQARKRCTVFCQASTRDNGQSTEGHLYFIGIMERTLRILKSEPVGRRQTTKTLPTGGRSSAVDGISNRFSKLEVEDIEDIIGDSAPPSEPAAATKSKAVVIYEVETDPVIDRIFRVFCFFEDLHRIQKFLADTWTKRKGRKLDFVTAAMITDAALDIIRHEEIKVTTIMFPNLAADIRVPLSYERLAEMLFNADSSAQDSRPELISHISLRMTPFDEFVYMKVARTLAKFKSFRLAPFPQKVPSPKNLFKNPALVATDRHHKMEADDRLLTQILMDFSLFEHTREKTLPVMPGDNPALRASQQQAEVLSQPTDLLTQGCWKLLNDGEISVWLVFGHQILLDIHAILGTKISGGWRKLQQQVSEHSSIIDYKMDIKAGRLRFPAERWPSGGGGELAGEFCQRLEITKSSETSGFQARKDAMLRFTNWQNVGGPSHEVISSLQGFGATLTNIQRSTQAMAELILTEPSREVNFIFAHDPIYCGFEAFRFAVDFETLGLALAKHHPGIFLVGHIYNACHQSDLLSIHWAELDEVIEQHIMVLFAGELPKTMKQCLKRAYVQIGVSATEFAKDKRNKSGKQKLRHWGPEMMPTKASAIFRRHFSQEVSMQQCLYQLDLLSQSTLTSPGKQVRQKQVTPLQLLSHIQDYLPTTFKAMEINYINLVKRCNNILLNIRNSIKDEMKINHPLVSPQDGGTETGFVRMVSEILQEADGIQDCQEEFFRRDMRGPMGPIRGGPQLRIAGNVLFEDVLTEALGKLETGA